MPAFKKDKRIRKSRDFVKVRAEGISSRSGPLKLSVRRDNRRRLGVVVSKGVGKAVERNRIKRVIREFFRQNEIRFPCGDCVVVAYAGTAPLKNDELRDRISKLALRLKRDNEDRLQNGN